MRECLCSVYLGGENCPYGGAECKTVIMTRAGLKHNINIPSSQSSTHLVFMIDHILYPLHCIQVYISAATHYHLPILSTLLTRIETVTLVYFPLLQPSHIIKESVLGRINIFFS